MSSDTEIAFQFISFVLRWLVGSITDNPFSVILAFLSVFLLYLSWTFLSSKGAPSFLTSSKTSVACLAVIAALCAQLYSFNDQLRRLQKERLDSEWRIFQGSQHRIELLDKLKFQLNASVIQNYEADYPEPNPLDGCLHVFIDLGSNRGLQIRKLYEPHNFPLAPVLPLYEKYFGKAETRSLKEVCSVSFEPNSKHAAHLRGMAEAYATCGINMLVMEAGVGHKDTVLKFAPFNQMYGHEVEHDASARLIHEDEGETMEAFAKSHVHSEVELEEVKVVRFAKFITETVAKRRLPTSAEVIRPSVVIKADIEGAELKILPDMIMTGALQHVDNLHMEWHGEASYRTGEEPKKIDKLEKAITVIAELAESEGLEDKFDIIEMDDETYSGILIYKPWGDYSEIPMMTC